MEDAAYRRCFALGCFALGCFALESSLVVLVIEKASNLSRYRIALIPLKYQG